MSSKWEACADNCVPPGSKLLHFIMFLLVLYLFWGHVGLRCMFWVVEKRHDILHSPLLVNTAAKRKITLFSWYGLISSFSLCSCYTLVIHQLWGPWRASCSAGLLCNLRCTLLFRLFGFLLVIFFSQYILFYFFTSVLSVWANLFSTLGTQVKFFGGYFPASNNLSCPAV